MRRDGSRVDAQDNRDRLISGVGRLLAAAGSFNLTELAEEAGVSRSTTYRNFSAPTDAIDAFIDQFLTEFEADVASAATTNSPLEHLVILCRAWGRLVDERSHALVHVRSTEGFLSRVRRRDPIIGRIHRLVRSAVVEAMEREELPNSDPDYAVFLWNLLLDPRELLDLAEHRGQRVTEAAELLTSEFLTLLHNRA